MPARSVQILRIVGAKHTVPWCISEMQPLCVIRILTASNADGLYGAYDPSTALNGPSYQCGSIGREVTQLSIW